MKVAIIPARGGSKRIPDKNIRLFAGKPIIAYSIEAAKASRLFERIIVSTDSGKIAAIANKYGAETPFIRPPELSDDHATSIAVLIHALQWLKDSGEEVQYGCFIYATAPFVQPEYLKQGFDLIEQEKAASAFSVTSFAASVFRAMKIDEQGRLRMIQPEYELTRSNDLQETYHDAGQFYWVDAGKFLQSGKIYTDDALPVVLPRYLVQDIDTEEDWQTAELMFKAMHMKDK